MILLCLLGVMGLNAYLMIEKTNRCRESYNRLGELGNISFNFCREWCFLFEYESTAIINNNNDPLLIG